MENLMTKKKVIDAEMLTDEDIMNMSEKDYMNEVQLDFPE